MQLKTMLSSQIGDRTETGNKQAAEQCVKDPKLISQIVELLNETDVNVLADACEVMTMIAEQQPLLVQEYAKLLLPLTKHKKTKVRWEATHYLAYIAGHNPSVISTFLDDLRTMATSDESTIVRDYATLTLANYADTSKQAASDTFPLLERILEIWGEKQAVRVFLGLSNVIQANPTLRDRALKLAEPYSESSRSSVKKAYKQMIRV